MADQRARVDIGEDGNLVLLHKLVGDLLRAPVGTDFRKLADDQTFDVGAVRLVVVGVGAVVADFRIGENDDLASVGRVGENCLVAGDGSVENDFAGALAFGAVAFASEDSTVFECKRRLHCYSWEWILGILAERAVDYWESYQFSVRAWALVVHTL